MDAQVWSRDARARDASAPFGPLGVAARLGRRRALVLASVGLTLLGLAVRLVGLGDRPPWVDEAFSWRWAHLPLPALWGAEGRLEYTPPLYYTLQHAFLALGDSPALLRLPSALLGALAVPLTLALGRSLAGPATGLLAAALVAVSGPLVAYSQEARSYALLVDAALVAGLGLALFLDTRRSPPRPVAAARRGVGLAVYAAGTTIALYTHATAVLLVLLANLVALAVLAARRPGGGVLLAWVGANLAALAAWSPWLVTVVAQARAAHPVIDYIAQPRPAAALVDLARFYGLHDLPALRPWDLALAPTWLLPALGLWRLRRRPVAAGMLCAFALGLPALLLLAGAAGRPLWLPRTLLWSLPFGLVLAAAGVARLRPPRARAALAAAVLALGLANLAGYAAGHPKEPWDRAAAAIGAGWRPGDGVAVFPPYAQAALRYQLRRDGRDDPILALHAEPPAEPSINDVDVPGVDDRLRRLDLADLAAAARGHGRLWLVVRNPEANDPDGLVRGRVAALGRVVERRTLRPFLELMLVEPPARDRRGG